MSQERKNNTKNLIMLAVSIVVAISICCAASYAWFYTQSRASANVSMGINSYNFSVNDETSGEFEINLGNFHPGVKYEYTLEFSNVGSNVPVIYDVSISDFSITEIGEYGAFPQQMEWKLISDDFSEQDIKTNIVNNQKFITGRTINIGVEHKYTLVCNWKKVENDATINANDTNWQRWYHENYPNRSITFKIKVEGKQNTN